MFGCGSWERDGREAESVNVIPSACEALSLAAVTAAAATSRAHSPSSLQGMRREAADSPKLWHPSFIYRFQPDTRVHHTPTFPYDHLQGVSDPRCVTDERYIENSFGLKL